MSRQEFLVTSGAILLGLFGVTALVKNVSKVFGEHGATASRRSSVVATQSFGGGAYGA